MPAARTWREIYETAWIRDKQNTPLVKIALTLQQVLDFDLPPQMGKSLDPRASAHIDKYGTNVAVELDALPPAALRQIARESIEQFTDKSTFKAEAEHEALEQERLQEILNNI